MPKCFKTNVTESCTYQGLSCMLSHRKLFYALWSCSSMSISFSLHSLKWQSDCKKEFQSAHVMRVVQNHAYLFKNINGNNLVNIKIV